MSVTVKVGDVLAEPVDVLICPANPWLNLSGGISGELLALAGPALQAELHEQLRLRGVAALEPGTVVVSSAGPLPAGQVLHAVAIDVFYGSSVELVATTLRQALEMASELQAKTVALPALATGFGPLSMEEFTEALVRAIESSPSNPLHLMVVLRSVENAAIVSEELARQQSA